jgi:hypothetical protein
MKKLILFLALALAIFSVNLARAEDFGNAMVIVSTNIPPGADAAGIGNTWVANPEFSTNNPAAMAAASGYRMSASGTYGFINFDKGPRMNLYSGTVTGTLPVGVLQVSYSDANSDRSHSRIDLAPGLKLNANVQLNESPSFNILYGLKLFDNRWKKGDEFYLGASFSRYNSKFTFTKDEDGGKIESMSSGYSFGLGFLYKPRKELSFGGFYSRSWEDLSDKSNGVGYSYASSNLSNRDLARLGVSWQILPMTMLAVDYQYLNYQYLGGANFSKHQLFSGVEQGIIKDFLYVYAGWAGEGPTAGIGMYFKSGGINLAYMNNPFPEINSSLGQGQVCMLTAYIKF